MSHMIPVNTIYFMGMSGDSYIDSEATPRFVENFGEFSRKNPGASMFEALKIMLKGSF